VTSLNDVYFIWSAEHQAWWRANQRGYAKGIKGAGEYTRDEAIAICRHALMSSIQCGHIAEIPVRRQDVMDMLDRQVSPAEIWVGKNNR
jgi:hypothetical protein